jgi:hypothetical protein
VAVKPEDVPADLPDHPDEDRLREAERELARTLRLLARDAEKALTRHDRVSAAVALAGLAQTAAAGQKAEVAAIQQQMRLAKEADPEG